MQLLNRAFGFIVKQVNKITIFHTDTTVSIEPIKNLFNSFQVTLALKNLNQAIAATDSTNPVNLYSFYLVKAEFELKLQQLNKFKKTIEFIEAEYNKLSASDNKIFKPLKLVCLSLEKKEDEFFDLAKKVSMSQDRDIEYYNLIYYINTGNQEKANDIIKKEDFNASVVNAEMSLLIGHVYNNLINLGHDLPSNYNHMIKYYDRYEDKTAEVDKFNLININICRCILATDSFNKRTPLSKIEKEITEKAILNLESILNELHNFAEGYQHSILNNLATFYKLLNEKDKFNSLVEKNFEVISEDHLIDYYFTLNNTIDNNIAYDIYKKKNFLNFLVAYIEYLYINKTKKEVIEFIESKELLPVKEKIINHFYFLSKTDLSIDTEDIFFKYDKTKEDSLFDAIIYLKSSKILNKVVDNSFLSFLDNYLSKTPLLSEYFIKMLVRLLFRLDNKFTYSLVIKLKELYPYLILYITELSSSTANLALNTFEAYINEIDITETIDKYNYFIRIGNVYNSFFHSFKTYEYYLKAWEEKNDIELAKRILDLIIRMHITEYPDTDVVSVRTV